MKTWIGIDYGAKKAGTTAICFERNNQLIIDQSKKDENADDFIIFYMNSIQPDEVFIDAPLSLPAVYNDRGVDFFYRQCDREVRAMSPMFLGGLTARAMKLKKEYSPLVSFYEAYPSKLIKCLDIDSALYKKKLNTLPVIVNKIHSMYNINLKEMPTNWHQFDAFLTWITGYRFQQEVHHTYGNHEEGLILV